MVHWLHGSGANWVTALYSAVLLENAMDGHKLTDADGKAPFINNVKMVTVPADCSDLYQKFFIDENPYEGRRNSESSL